MDVVVMNELKGTAKRIAPPINGLGTFIREQREQAEVSLRQLADLAGVSNPYLSQIERGLRKPSAEILQQIANGLRISAEQLYLRAGILEARDGEAGTEAAILADPVLTERQKHVLVEIYESFCRENRGGDPTPPPAPARTTTPTTPTTKTASGRTASHTSARS